MAFSAGPSPMRRRYSFSAWFLLKICASSSEPLSGLRLPA